jgi:hypothetical protein
MKPLLLLLLFLAALRAESVYLLPHRWHDARHELNSLIRHAKGPLIIVTDRLDDVHLQRALRYVLNAKRSVLFITASKETASQWAMYRSANVCVLPPNQKVDFTLVAETGGKACVLGGAAEAEAWRERYGLLLCQDAAQFEQTLTLLRRECRDYFTGTSR